MNESTRRVVAYAVAISNFKNAPGAIYDYSTSRHYSFSGSASKSSCSFYDYTQRCHISGSPTSLFDYGNSKYISVNYSGTNFSGFDYASQRHFSGHFSSGAVVIYDHEHSRHFNYSA